MSLRWAIFLALGCDEGKGRAPEGGGADTAGGGLEDTADPQETAESEDSADTADPQETGDPPIDTGDTAPDTGEPEEEPCLGAIFTRDDGVVEDLTKVFTDGDYITLSEPGTLTFCPGAWYVRLILAGDVAVVGLGEAPEETVLSAGYQGRVIVVEGGAQVSIENVTVTQGLAPGSGLYSNGGGVNCEGSALEVRDVAFTSNEAEDGGGLAAWGCDLTVEGASFVGNVGADDAGGLRLWKSDAALEDVLFEGNAARDGGAIMMYDSVVAITGAAFEGNTADWYGGAIWQYMSTLQVYNSSFADNVINRYGGAIFSLGDTYVEGSAFSGNAAGFGGGALFYAKYGTLEGTGCDFAGNIADDLASYHQSLALGAGASFACSGSLCAGP